MNLEILHISDVHFGPPHVPELADAVRRMARDRQPDLTVVSGDLTQRAKPEQFRQARRFVDSLPAPTIVVPGNHDVALYRLWERFLDPYGAYRRNFSPVLEPVVRTRGMLAIGVNTAHGLTFTGGRITKRRLRQVVGLLEAEAEAEPLLKIVVAHHHLVPPPRFGPQDVSKNAAEAIEAFAEAGAELILSGHHHQSFVASSEEFYPRGLAPMVIVHSGTTTSNRGRGSERGKNTCFRIAVDDRVVSISQLRWETQLERFAEHSRQVYPRRHRSPRTLE